MKGQGIGWSAANTATNDSSNSNGVGMAGWSWLPFSVLSQARMGGGVVVLCVAVVVVAVVCSGAYVDYVDPFIGTGGLGYG